MRRITSCAAAKSASLQRRLAEQQRKLRLVVGVGLGHGPDHEDQVPEVRAAHAARARPAFEGLSTSASSTGRTCLVIASL